MPTVRELKKQQSSPPVQQDYAIEGDGIRIEVHYGQPSDSMIPPALAEGARVIDLKSQNVQEHQESEAVDRARAEHRALRDRVFQYLRGHIAGYENKQRQLKKFVKENYGKLDLRFVVVAANREAIKNACVLSRLYGVVRFLRTGNDDENRYGLKTETFFNNHFHNREFRNDFWTYWNKRHNQQETQHETPADVPAEQSAPAKKTAAPASGNTKPYRCPHCNQFVSRKTNFCKRCDKTVEENYCQF
jgi:hypothetical protein|nr:MAG TPA: zinc-ribbon containing domain protein [Caudoviricetes sp.]